MQPSQVFALVVGVAYLILGLVGFLETGFGAFAEDTGDALIGVFDLNPFHNVVHLAVGALLVVAALGSLTVTHGILIGGGLVYILAALVGFIFTFPPLSINTNAAPDNFLHLISGALALAVGALAAREGPGPMGTT